MIEMLLVLLLGQAWQLDLPGTSAASPAEPLEATCGLRVVSPCSQQDGVGQLPLVGGHLLPLSQPTLLWPFPRGRHVQIVTPRHVMQTALVQMRNPFGCQGFKDKGCLGTMV